MASLTRFLSFRLSQDASFKGGWVIYADGPRGFSMTVFNILLPWNSLGVTQSNSGNPQVLGGSASVVPADSDSVVHADSVSVVPADLYVIIPTPPHPTPPHPTLLSFVSSSLSCSWWPVRYHPHPTPPHPLVLSVLKSVLLLTCTLSSPPHPTPPHPCRYNWARI